MDKTGELFREDAYLKSCEATVTAVDEKGGSRFPAM